MTKDISFSLNMFQKHIAERKEGLVSGVGCCCGGVLVFTLGSDSIM